ncbi:IclR family transcriptional regulator [Rhodobacteraceae bacterium 4F10]|nr:IclR family transcriptional regulator [Rhodobacteraceae bacterium 4F10]
MPDLKEDKRYANTLARGLRILRAFRPTDDGLSNLQISDRTGIPRSTVSRLTFTLCALGYLTHGRHHDRYRLGPSALALGNIAAASFGFVETATPIMQALANETKTLVGVAIHDDDRMLLVKTWRPENTTTVWLNVGYRIPLSSSSTGAAYLGALSDAEFEKLTGPMDEASRSECAALRMQFQEMLLARGFAIADTAKRFNASINAIASPYRPTDFAQPVAFLASARTEELTFERAQTEVGPALVNALYQLQDVTGQQHSALPGI